MDIFIINTSDANHISNDLLKQFEHKNFSNPVKRKEHCLSYLMLDRILKEVYKISERDILIIGNKPFLKNNKKFFSISHSNEYLTIACSDYECGIDIEQIKDRPFEQISKRMNFNANSLEEFYYSWTRYEANYKLNNQTQSLKQFQYENYVVTAVSTNTNEEFNILIQSSEQFPNL